MKYKQDLKILEITVIGLIKAISVNL